MFEQFFLGLALIGCLVLGYRLLRPAKVGSCHNAQCECEEPEGVGAMVRHQKEGK